MRLPTVVSCAGWKWVGEARHVAIAAGRLGERDEHRRDPAKQQLQAFPHQDQVGVVGDVGARRAQMNERPRRRRLLAQMVDVRHHVVADPLLVLRRTLQVGVVQVGAQLRERLLRDIEAELALGLHQRQPEPPP